MPPGQGASWTCPECGMEMVIIRIRPFCSAGRSRISSSRARLRPYENTQDRAKLTINLVPKLHQSVVRCATMRSVPPNSDQTQKSEPSTIVKSFRS